MRYVKKMMRLPSWGNITDLKAQYGSAGVYLYQYTVGGFYWAIDRKAATLVALRYNIPFIEHVASGRLYKVPARKEQKTYAVYRKHFRDGDMVQVDTVYFAGRTLEEVHDSLINHDGYAPDIQVVDCATGEEFPKEI